MNEVNQSADAVGIAYEEPSAEEMEARREAWRNRWKDWPENQDWSVRGEFPYRLKMSWAWRNFWKRNGDARFNWGEITNYFGFALKLHEWSPGVWKLNVHLGWPSFFINLTPTGDMDWENNRAWGVSMEGPQFFFRWGNKGKFLSAPWASKRICGEYLKKDGSFAAPLPRPAFEPGKPWPEEEELHPDRWQTRERYFYTARGVGIQEGYARLYVSRAFFRPLWRAWLPLFSHEERYIDVEFSDEVGNRAGSWKGGTIGCSYEMKRGEDASDTFRRMMRERSFDR